MADQTLVKTFTDIADAIRAKDGSTGTMKPTEMPGKIAAIQTATADSYLVDNTVGGIRVSDYIFSMSIPVSKLSVQKTPVSLKYLRVNFNSQSSNVPDGAVTSFFLTGYGGETFFDGYEGATLHVFNYNMIYNTSIYSRQRLSRGTSEQPSKYMCYMKYNASTNTIDIAVNVDGILNARFDSNMINFVVGGFDETLFGV